MKNLILTVCLLAGFSSCATVPMDESKPVEFSQGFFRHGFYQDGHFLDNDDAKTKISKVPGANDEIQAARTWITVATVVDVVGAVLVITAPTPDRGVTPAQTYYGFGLLLAAIPVQLIGEGHFVRAADIYNDKTFTKSKTTSAKFYLSPLRDGASAGLALQF